MKKLLLIVAVAISAIRPCFALDPKNVESNLRKQLGLDSRVEISVDGNVTPAGIGDLNQTNVVIQGAPYLIYFGKDEKKYFFGGVQGDFSKDPDKEYQSKINLKGVHSQGSTSASVTIVEYSDLQCSHCKTAHEMLKGQLYKNYTKNQVRLVFKHFPLAGHAAAEPAAAATECAAKQKESAFWDMTDYFFANQAKLSTATVQSMTLEAAKSFQLDILALQQCLNSGAMLEKIRADKKEGTEVGVNSTPTVFINGRVRRGFRDFSDFQVVIDEKLKESKK